MKKLLTIVGILGLVAVALIAGTASLPAVAADHLDAPGATSPGGDARLDINDVYAFQSPANSANAVLIMTVSPAAGVIGPVTFHPNASYEFKIDTNGDAKEDMIYKLTFSAPDGSNVQSVMLRRVPASNGGAVLARGQTGQDIAVEGGGMLRAGRFDDPFFFDLVNFNRGATFCGASGGVAVSNFFQGLNTLAIVLEVPRASLGSNNIGVWSRTERDGQQVDRMGRPAINTVFIPNNPFEPAGTEPSQKNAFNAGKPRQDQRDFRAEVVDTLEIFYGAGSQPAQALADFLLPDVLTVDTSSSAGFPNGRRLPDDVIDIELGLVTNNAVTTDCVGNDSTFANTFPYLAQAN